MTDKKLEEKIAEIACTKMSQLEDFAIFNKISFRASPGYDMTSTPAVIIYDQTIAIIGYHGCCSSAIRVVDLEKGESSDLCTSPSVHDIIPVKLSNSESNSEIDVRYFLVVGSGCRENGMRLYSVTGLKIQQIAKNQSNNLGVEGKLGYSEEGRFYLSSEISPTVVDITESVIEIGVNIEESIKFLNNSGYNFARKNDSNPELWKVYIPHGNGICSYGFLNQGQR